MVGHLASYLQEEFERRCRRGGGCSGGKGTRVCNLVKISSYYYDLIFFSRKLAKRTKSSGEQERGQENHALSLKEVYSRSRAKRRA